MRIAINAVPDVDDVGTAVLAEELGFDAFYVGDNPVVWADPYVTLALIAQRTERIRIGTMVSVAGVRSPIVTATALGTINRLAPGRVVCGVGTGNTAPRLLGVAPMPMRRFEAELAELRDLLRGEEVLRRVGDRDVWVGRDPEATARFVALDPPIPLVVSAFGPRAMRLAGRYGDGLIGGLGTDPAFVADAWAIVRAGAAEAGRTLDPATYYTGSVTSMCVLRPGETLGSRRVVDEVGAMALASLHVAYEQHRRSGTPPPDFVADVWPAYVAMIEQVPPDRRHQRIHRGTSTWLVPEDRRFVTPELIAATCMVGAPEELAERIGALAATGLVDELVIAPLPAAARGLLRDVAERVRPLLPG